MFSSKERKKSESGDPLLSSIERFFSSALSLTLPSLTILFSSFPSPSRKKKILWSLTTIWTERWTSLRTELSTLCIPNSVTRRVNLVVVVRVGESLGWVTAAIGDDVVADAASGSWRLGVTSAVASGGADVAAASSGGVGDVDRLEEKVSVEGKCSDLVATKDRADLVVALALSVLRGSWCTNSDGSRLSGDKGRGCRGGGGDKGRHGHESGSIGWNNLRWK